MYLLGYLYITLVVLILGGITYEYFLEINSPKKMILVLMQSKLVIIFIATIELLIILMTVQFILFCFLSMTELGHLIYTLIPKFISVFLFGAWIQGAKEYYIFCLEASIYLTIGCSVFEYYILKEKCGDVNSKHQIIKAVLFSNIPVCLMVMGCFIYIYHTNPAFFD